MSARTAAGEVLREIIADGRSLDTADRRLAAIGDARDRALARELVYGVLRWLPRLRFVCRLLAGKRELEPVVEVAVLMGLHQLEAMRVPAHAATSESVELVARAGRPRARGLVNATLRRYTRERDAILAQVRRHPPAHFAHPRWLLAQLRRAWPDDWETVVDANNQRAPMTLRVNTRRCTRDQYAERLRAAGHPAHPVAHATDALALEHTVDVAALPGFADGEVSVQDAAAQLAAALLDPPPGARVLDACAAPGGKTGHLLERAATGVEVVAIDVDPTRAQRVDANLARLGLAATVICGDATQPSRWWDGRGFDRILVDAPCSASGVLRRHPDIKLLRRAADIPRLAARQRALLEALWPLLAAGGRLLYATCSVLPEENDGVVDAFLADHDDARGHALDGGFGRATRRGRQILPGEDAMDGFFYALLARPH